MSSVSSGSVDRENGLKVGASTGRILGSLAAEYEASREGVEWLVVSGLLVVSYILFLVLVSNSVLLNVLFCDFHFIRTFKTFPLSDFKSHLTFLHCD